MASLKRRHSGEFVFNSGTYEYDSEGYNIYGFNRDGYNKDGYNSDNFNRDGFKIIYGPHTQTKYPQTPPHLSINSSYPTSVKKRKSSKSIRSFRNIEDGTPLKASRQTGLNKLQKQIQVAEENMCKDITKIKNDTLIQLKNKYDEDYNVLDTLQTTIETILNNYEKTYKIKQDIVIDIDLYQEYIKNTQIFNLIINNKTELYKKYNKQVIKIQDYYIKKCEIEKVNQSIKIQTIKNKADIIESSLNNNNNTIFTHPLNLGEEESEIVPVQKVNTVNTDNFTSEFEKDMTLSEIFKMRDGGGIRLKKSKKSKTNKQNKKSNSKLHKKSKIKNLPKKVIK